MNDLIMVFKEWNEGMFVSYIFCFFVHWVSDFLFHEDKDKQKALRSIHMRSLFYLISIKRGVQLTLLGWAILLLH